MQEVLDTNNLQAASRTDARKEKLDAAAVWDLMGSADRIVVAKGKRVETFVPAEDTQDSILKAVMGTERQFARPDCADRRCLSRWLQRYTL